MQIKTLLLALLITACAALGVHGKLATSVAGMIRDNTDVKDVQTHGSRNILEQRNELKGNTVHSTNAQWSTMQDRGCDPNRAGIRAWSATLNGASGDLGDACYSTNATVANVSFDGPSECEVSFEKVVTGYFDTTDPLCGVPPCPDNTAWDYATGMCISCQTGIAPTKPNELQKRHGKQVLGKRVNCPQLGAFHLPSGRIILRLANNVQAWVTGQEQGPTAAQLAAIPEVQAEFQRAWEDTYAGANGNTMRETGGWIYMNPNNRGSVVVRRVTARGRTGRPTTIRPPPMSSIGINLAHPDEETTPVPEGHIMVATFHTHPSANPERYNPGLPSAQDNRLEWERGLPGIIIHDRGLTAYGPRARAQMDGAGPQNFPMSNLDPGNTHENDRGNSIGSWVPSRVANQPPQSSPPASPSCFSWGCGHDELKR